MPISGLLTFWKGRERMVLNTVIALTTIFSQQAFSFFTFKCPCKTTLNLYYALSFIAVPALVLLILGYAINNMTWKLIMSFGYGTQLKLNSCKLICFVLLSVTGRAVIAPVTWVAVTLLNGLYYQCGMSEFLSVSSWNVFQNLTLRERKDILARFPCPKVSIKKIHNISEIRNEANRILLYQSQSTELLILTYGSLVAQLCEDCEKDEDINKELDKMGRNIGTRLVEDFLARSNVAQCRNFYETAEVIAKVAFKMYLGVTPRVTFWGQTGDDCSLFLEKNPLISCVEIPEKHSCLLYSNMICGILKGALKMVRLQVDVQLLQDSAKDGKMLQTFNQYSSQTKVEK
ncbi:calcium homeostasis modulator protein 4-like isoform X2 [Stegostoma tigrinum]|uniref:calcium homeostasis modulator protein 4-like isoform X2 n=1 Tax=Stegostoma tigrinum TaxID=3053191 RepID=UPI0028704CA3|nr:calcium homeostasis modulator protein 4-like isoform X2 [Stegostoma tigrinum]